METTDAKPPNPTNKPRRGAVLSFDLEANNNGNTLVLTAA